ncbi:integrase [Paraburkholderia caballeronis]|nr:integrase [Paraburkholderia caballeronis]TDV08005.1 integrase [Paraburkholderia caballeronis]TDV18731.1 integrase [Paraburkholderia caballeronis]
MQVGKLVDPGYYADGGGLYLQISVSGARSWIFMFTLLGRRREMGLGPLTVVSLAAARKEAAECREFVRVGTDPIEARKGAIRVRMAAETPSRTFRDAADAFISARESGWNNPKHRQQWRNTLELYAYPTIGDVLVCDIDTPMIVRILQPIWLKKAETARRVRGRIKAILDAEESLGHRSGDNPARYVDHLDRVLPRSKKRQQVKHHPALPWEEMPAFFADLRMRPRRASRALRLLVLTATRTNEIRFARPDEFDLETKVWTIPGARMKAGVELRVPLCDEAVELVRAQIEHGAADGWLFPGYKKGCPLSNMALLKVLKVMGRTGITVHGFRSTFRDWVAECTEYPDSLAEQALAHTISSMTVAAYRRRDMLERRRAMMEDWARYCAGKTGAVLPFTPAESAA